MPPRIVTLVTLLFLTRSLFAADSPKSPAARSALAEYAAALSLADEAYANEMRELHRACVDQMAAAARQAMAQSNLDESNRFTAAVAEWQKASLGLERWALKSVIAAPDLGDREPRSIVAAETRRRFEFNHRKSYEAYERKVLDAARKSADKLVQASREALKAQDLTDANLIVEARRQVERDAQKKTNRFPRGAVLVFSFDRESLIERDGQRYFQDLGPRHNDALVTGTTLAEGIVGEAAHLAPGDALKTIGKVGISGAAPRTVCFWLNLPTLPKPKWAHIAGWGGDGRGTHFCPTIHQGEYILWSSGAGHDWYTGVKVELNQWHHHTILFNGQAALWLIDGLPVNKPPFRHAYNTIDSPLDVRGLGLLIDDLVVYNRVLMGDEVNTMVRKRKTKP